MYLLEFFWLDGRKRCPKSRDALSGVVSCNSVYLLCIGVLILEVCEMKAVGTVCMQLQEARGNDVVVQVYSLAANVALSLQDGACLVGDDKMVFDELAVENIAGVCEEGEPARHGRLG